jgi:hypothetical protein
MEIAAIFIGENKPPTNRDKHVSHR